MLLLLGLVIVPGVVVMLVLVLLLLLGAPLGLLATSAPAVGAGDTGVGGVGAAIPFC